MSCLWVNFACEKDAVRKRCKLKSIISSFSPKQLVCRHAQLDTFYTLAEKKLSQCQIEEMKRCTNFFFHSILRIALASAD